MISRLEFNFKSDSKAVVEEIVVNENANALEKSFCLTLECSKWAALQMASFDNVKLI